MAAEAESMDRGSEPLKAHLGSTGELTLRQTRRGCFQELLGCEAQTEFKYFIGEKQIAQSLEDASFFCRVCCTPLYPYEAVVKESETEAEIISVERPLRCPQGSCKCCLYQEMIVKSGGEELGSVVETFYCCVPELSMNDHEGNKIYRILPATCLGGMCVNCCSEGNPCGKGCCKTGFYIFPPDAEKTEVEDSIGKILKKPKSLMTEIFTDANVFDITYPESATVSQKGILIGASLLINSLFFEGNNE